jgi:hypothetical protein
MADASELRCPFLASAVAQRYSVLPGDEAAGGRPLFQGVASFTQALLAAHGRSGVLPLPRCDVAAAEAGGCPYAATMRAQAAAAAAAAPDVHAAAVAPAPPLPTPTHTLARRLARCPLATISFTRPGGPLTPVRVLARLRAARCRCLRRASDAFLPSV